MAAAQTDKFIKTYQRFSTTLSADKAVSATAMTLSTTTTVPTDTGAIASVYDTSTVNGSETITVSTLAVYSGVVSGSQITGLVLEEGTDQLHTAGMKVSLLFTSTHWNRVMEGILVHADQDGTLKTDSVDTAAITDANVTTAKLATDSVTTAKIDWSTLSNNIKSATNTSSKTLTNGANTDLGLNGATTSFTLSGVGYAFVTVDIACPSTSDFEFRPQIFLNGVLAATANFVAAPGTPVRAFTRSFSAPIPLANGVNTISAGIFVSSSTGAVISANAAFLTSIVLGDVTA